MSIELPAKILSDDLVRRLKEDLHLKGKKTKQGGKARVSELHALITTDRSYIIPLHYARGLIELTGMREPRPVHFKIAELSFRDDQYCQQKPVFVEAMKVLKEQKSVFLQLHCGWGKTWMALAIAAHLGLRTMVLVHRRFLAGQFLTESEVVMPGQMMFIEDNEAAEQLAYIEGPKVPQMCNMFVCTDRRALTLPKAFTSTIDFLIVDEAKYWCTPERVKALLAFNPTHTMGLCAERERKDGYHTILAFFFGHNIFRKSCKPFIVHKYFTSFVPKIQKPAGYSRARIDWNVAMQSLSQNEKRNEMICNICRLRQNNKIMILVHLREHVETLERMLKAYGEKVATFYAKKDSYSNCRILIATYSKAEMGFDDKNLCENFDGERLDLLILGAFYKEEIEQSAGRVMRSDAPEVIDIVDNHPSLSKHSKTRDKWFKSRNGQVMPAEYFFDMKLG
uniref:Helicase/UvrB N-terminal domain-containing protein n=1 Tax=viral metagenome TaxID=1070528 RepID=A0A6C0CIZ4_9ZZZZ